MSLAQRASLLLSVCTWLAVVCAIPSFEGITYWHSDIGTLVPGMSTLEALGPNNNYENGYFVQRHVAVSGEIGVYLDLFHLTQSKFLTPSQRYSRKHVRHQH